MTDPELLRASYAALRTSGATAVVEREVVEVRGPDAGTYLQGQVSQDILGMAGPSTWSFILQPSGRVTSWMRVHRAADDRFLLEVEPGSAEALVARLRRFLMRTDAVIGEPSTWSLISHRCGAGIEPPKLPTPVGALEGELLVDERGRDLLVPLPLHEVIALCGEVVDPQVLERARISRALPRMGSDLTEETIPAEAGAVIIEASVSFTKGCYTGQELVARIDSRGGNVPRPLRLLCFAPDGFAPGGGPAVGDAVMVDGEEVGRLTSVCVSLGHSLPALALAPLPRALEFDTVVSVATAGGARPATLAMPPADA